jgi:hypothetical protein
MMLRLTILVSTTALAGVGLAALAGGHLMFGAGASLLGLTGMVEQLRLAVRDLRGRGCGAGANEGDRGSGG